MNKNNNNNNNTNGHIGGVVSHQSSFSNNTLEIGNGQLSVDFKQQ